MTSNVEYDEELAKARETEVRRQASRHIPEGIKRAVRQRAGFGCVVCGHPIVEYHHMTPFAEVNVHTLENITALCPNHHADTTGRAVRLPEAKVRHSNAHPHNMDKKITTPQPLHFADSTLDLNVGSTHFIAEPPQPLSVLQIDGLELVALTFEDGQAMLNLILFDKNNRLLLQIVKNEVTANTGNWDIHWEGSTLTVRRGAGQILFRATFDTGSSTVDITHADFLFNGIHIMARPSELSLQNPPVRPIGSSNWMGAGPGGTCIAAGLRYANPVGIPIPEPIERLHGYASPDRWGLLYIADNPRDAMDRVRADQERRQSVLRAAAEPEAVAVAEVDD